MPRVRLLPVLPARVEVQSLVLLSREGAEAFTSRRGTAAALDAVGQPAGWADVLHTHVSRASATGAAGDVVSVPVVVEGRAIEQVVVVGTGAGSEADLRRAGAALVRATPSGDVLVVGLGRTGGAGVRALVEGIGLGRYAFRRPTGPDGRPSRSWPRTLVARPSPRARRTAAAVRLARDLTNTPSSTKSPQWLVQQARSVARRAGLTIEVRDHRRLAAEGFGGLIAVGQGSTRPPRLVRARLRPDGHLRPAPRESFRTRCSSARGSRSTPGGSRSSRRRR